MTNPQKYFWVVGNSIHIACAVVIAVELGLIAYRLPIVNSATVTGIRLETRNPVNITSLNIETEEGKPK